MATDGLQERIEALENRVVELETQAYQRAKDAAYVFIHSNWHMIRWYLNRQRDINGDPGGQLGKAHRMGAVPQLEVSILRT